MAGLDQLYSLWEEYPDLPVEQLISQTSTAFQGYISKGLDKVRPMSSLIACKSHEQEQSQDLWFAGLERA